MSQAPRDNRVQFRVNPDLAAWLEQRQATLTVVGTPPGGIPGPGYTATVQRELHMWRTAIALEQGRTTWTVPELCLIADVLNGTMTPMRLGNVVAFEVADALRIWPGAHPEKWGVDADELMAKLDALGPVADHATAAAIAAFWTDINLDPSHPQTWRDLGFRISTPPTKNDSETS